MQKSDLPDFLKKGQNDSTQVRVSQAVTFNKTFHVDTIRTINEPEKVIITITDDSRSFSASTVITDDSTTSMIIALCDYLFKPYGYPENDIFQTRKGANQQIGKDDQQLGTINTYGDLQKQEGHFQHRGGATMATKSKRNFRRRIRLHH
jgi:hypothetical protein